MKEAIPNILKTLICKGVQEGFSASGRGKNNLPFKTIWTYKTMRGEIQIHSYSSKNSETYPEFGDIFLTFYSAQKFPNSNLDITENGKTECKV